MALVTSGSSADSYISLADAETYAGKYFMGTDKTAWDAASDANKEASLRQAAQYIDSRFRDRFVGTIRSTSQALEWPRVNAEDRSGRVINDVPDEVKNAAVELAKERIVAGTHLVPSESRGGQVKREKVDVIEVEYFDNAPAGTTYRWIADLLSAVLKTASHRVVRV